MNSRIRLGARSASEGREKHPSLALRAPIAILLLLAAAIPAQAALDPELKKPYQLQIVLHVADNRALTPLFQETLQRALGDQLRQSFGALAEVRVERTHPLLAEILARGLEPVLDAWDHADSTQTHFVLLNYTAGEYRLQARGHDGMTGQPTAIVRRAQTGDRALVPVLAAQLVEQNFAPVGTVTALAQAGKETEVQLTLKGGGLGVPLGRWVKPGEVFAISRISAQGTQGSATRIGWALLEVIQPPQEGVCRCRYWRRFVQDSLREVPGVLGYRAIKLATTQGPIRLRVMDEEGYQPLQGMQVQVFRPGTKEKAEVTTNRDGLAVTREDFANFAVVYLPREKVQMPVELIEGRTVVCRVNVQGGSETRAALEYRREAWLRRVYDDLRLASDNARELTQKVSQSLKAAQETAGELLASLDAELKDLRQEHEALKQLALDNKLAAAKFDLKDGEQRLAELREKRDKLSEFAVRIEKAIKEGEENKLLNQQLERARLLEAEADFGRAIAVYEKVLEARPKETKVREHLDELKASWALKDDKHAVARAFVYETWPKLDFASLKKNLATARQAVATLKAAGDRLTAEKMRQTDAIHVANLNKELERLKRNFTDDNKSRAKAINDIATGLSQLHAELTAFIGVRKE
jgi:hypothetical protein